MRIEQYLPLWNNFPLSFNQEICQNNEWELSTSLTEIVIHSNVNYAILRSPLKFISNNDQISKWKKKKSYLHFFLLFHVSLLVWDWSYFIPQFDLWEKQNPCYAICISGVNLHQCSRNRSRLFPHQISFLPYHFPTIVLFTSICVFYLSLISAPAISITTLPSTVLIWDQNSH